MSLIREAFSDETGQGDIAYVSIGLLTFAAVISLAFICGMSAISYGKCQPITTMGADIAHIQPCVFDPLPVGQAAGLIFAAFATLIGTLSGYMLATRKQSRQAAALPAPAISTTTTTETKTAPIAADAASDEEALKPEPKRKKK